MYGQDYGCTGGCLYSNPVMRICTCMYVSVCAYVRVCVRVYLCVCICMCYMYGYRLYRQVKHGIAMQSRDLRTSGIYTYGLGRVRTGDCYTYGCDLQN